MGFWFGSKLPGHFVMDQSTNQDIPISTFLSALVAGLFAFGGWHMVTYSSEETVNSQRTIPHALMYGTIIVTICYILLNVVYLYILPLDIVASSNRIAADAANAVTGYGGGAFMAAIVIISTFGALSGIILCGPRVYYSMAKDGLLFRWIGAVHPRYRTPHRAIFMQAVWSSVLVVTGTYTTLFTRVVYTEWIFFALMAGGLILLRRRSDVIRGYKIWGYPVIPAVFIISSSAIVANQIISDPRESLFGLSLVFSGLPVYYLWVKKKRRSRPDDH